ncbi:MAG: hypothetical protein U1G08_08625 [Verrucomicrobiota bacterium]
MRNLIITAFLLLTPLADAAEKELLINGGFESGRNTGWATFYDLPGASTSAEIVNLSYPYTGSWYAYLGDRTATSTSARGHLIQSIHVPPLTTRLTLRFRMSIASADSTTRAFDQLEAVLLDSDGVKVASFGEWDNRDQNENDDPLDYQAYREQINNADKFSDKDLILQFYASTDQGLYTTFRIDDVSLIADTENPPPQYAITALSDEHGSVDPSGVILITGGSSLTLTASPAEGYKVKYWLLDGVTVGEGENLLNLNNINSNHAIKAIFEPAQYTIRIFPQIGGDISVDPLQPSYAFGSRVVIKAVPNLGFYFSKWIRGIQGTLLERPVTVSRDLEISGEFFKNPVLEAIKIQPVDLSSILLKHLENFDYVQNESPDMTSWTETSVISGNFDTGIDLKNVDPFTVRTYKKWVLCEKRELQPFLTVFPLEGLTVESATVTALLDHHRISDGSRARRDGIIRTCNNHVISIDGHKALGYKLVDGKRVEVTVSNDPKHPNYFGRDDIATVSILLRDDEQSLSLPFRYGSPMEISYDEHSGYDYSIRDPNTGEITHQRVVAAASGKFNPTASRQAWNEIVLDHNLDVDYQTQYWHLLEWSDKIEEAYRNNQSVDVAAGEYLGLAGGASRTGIDSNGNPIYNFNAYPWHLHFEVRRFSPADGNSWILADPYGIITKNGDMCQQVLWKTR